MAMPPARARAGEGTRASCHPPMEAAAVPRSAEHVPLHPATARATPPGRRACHSAPPSFALPLAVLVRPGVPGLTAPARRLHAHHLQGTVIPAAGLDGWQAEVLPFLLLLLDVFMRHHLEGTSMMLLLLWLWTGVPGGLG